MCEGGVFAISEARAVCEQMGLDEDDASIMSAVRSVQYLTIYVCMSCMALGHYVAPVEYCTINMHTW